MNDPDVVREVVFNSYEFPADISPKITLCPVGQGVMAMLQIGPRPVFEFKANDAEYLETIGLLFAQAAHEVRNAE